MLAHLVARASAGERSGPRQGLGLHMPEASEKGDVRERPPGPRGLNLCSSMMWSSMLADSTV